MNRIAIFLTPTPVGPINATGHYYSTEGRRHSASGGNIKMAVNRVTRTGGASVGWVKTVFAKWGGVFGGSIVGLVALISIAGASLSTSLSAGHIIFFAVIGAVALIRLTWPPTAKHPIVAWTAQTDRVVLPLAAVAVAGWALGGSADLVFPVNLMIVLWAAASLSRVSLGAAVGYAAAAELGRFFGRGAWMGDVSPLALHLAFLAGFCALGAMLLRHEVSLAKRKVALDAEKKKSDVESRAKKLGLSDSDAPADHLDLAERIDGIQNTIGHVLGLAKKAMDAHSVVLMTRADSWEQLQVFCAVSREQDILNQEPVSMKEGLLAVLLRLQDEGEDEPVLRVSPLEGRTAQLPYYSHTPARIKSLLAIPVRRGDHIMGALFFDRLAGAAFDDGAVVHAQKASKLLSELLTTEQLLVASDRRSETLDHLMEANGALNEAFGPEEMYESILVAAGKLAPVRFGALLVRDGAAVRVMHAMGEGAEECKGCRVDTGSSLGAMVIKTPTPVPPSRTWHPKHGALLGKEIGPKPKAGDPVIAIPLVVHKKPVGALVLLGSAPFDDNTVSTLRLLASQAAISVEHAQALAELQNRASTDGLTALDNRSTVLGKLDQSLARCGRASQSLAVMILDIDHFKQVNDNHGHQAGDMVLRQVARTLDESKRINDAVGRYGGEEFVIVLEDISGTGPRVVAERIRQKIQSLNFPSQTGPFRITASIGYAVCPEDGERADALLKKADAALYVAKENGRNQVIAHGERPVHNTGVRAVNG